MADAKEKDELKKEYERQTIADTQRITLGISVNSFPFSLWREWQRDCKERFGDCRWVKMWSDHLAAQEGNLLKEVYGELTALRKEIYELRETITEYFPREKPKEKEEVKTLGGE